MTETLCVPEGMLASLSAFVKSRAMPLDVAADGEAAVRVKCPQAREIRRVGSRRNPRACRRPAISIGLIMGASLVVETSIWVWLQARLVFRS